MIRPRSLALICSATVLLLVPTSSVFAWGRIGHRASAKVTDSLLSPSAKAAVADLLDPNETLAEASTWPDEVRRDRPKSAPWHYVNVMITEDHFDPKFNPPEGSVITAIAAMKATLRDPNATKLDKKEALRYLVHFVEDMHQPLHVGHRADKGGNQLQVRFFADGSNLHRVWDSGVVEAFSKDESVWEKTIKDELTPENLAMWSKGTVEDWATESLLAAKSAYLDGSIKPGAKLAQDYQDMALPIARRRLAQSAARLAMILNETFPAAP